VGYESGFLGGRLRADRVNERAQWRCHLSLRGKAQMEARKRCRPPLQQRHESARDDVRSAQLVSRECDTDSVERGLQAELLAVRNDRPLDRDLEPLAVFQELPLVRPLMSWPAPADALVGQQMAGMLRCASAGEVVRRSPRQSGWLHQICPPPHPRPHHPQ
jgi:hypothetical protein